MAFVSDAGAEQHSGAGTWDREARRVTALASELGVALDEETLILCDIRDLMSLRRRLREALHRGCSASGRSLRATAISWLAYHDNRKPRSASKTAARRPLHWHWDHKRER